MTTDRHAGPPSRPAAATPPSELKRIPLPPLPHFRRTEEGAPPSDAAMTGPNPAADPAPAHGPGGSVSHLEMSELLAPDHEGGIAPPIDAALPQRTGTTGATILNDLVDEIEKGLERDLARAPLEVTTEGYRRVVTCASGPSPRPPGAPAQAGHPRRSDA